MHDSSALHMIFAEGDFENAQVVYVEEDEVEAEDPFAADQEDGGSQDSGEESDEGDEDLQDVNHDDVLDNVSDDE